MAISSQELRIGNWVEHNAVWSYRNDDQKKFIFQWEDRDWYAAAESTLNLSDISPIPLTPEILEKCGFNKINNKWQKNEGDNVYLYGSNGFYAPSTMPEIKTLHQLQNLYYALTGTELTYSP